MAQQHSFNCCLHCTTPPLLKYLLNKFNNSEIKDYYSGMNIKDLYLHS